MSELRRELLKVELETARIKQSATIQQHDNSLKDKERLDLQVENEKLKRELLLNECRIKGIELLEEMNPYDWSSSLLSCIVLLRLSVLTK